MKKSQRLKQWIRGLYLLADSMLFGQRILILMPNGRKLRFHISSKDRLDFQQTVNEEIGGYWAEHQPREGEVHLDIGAQVGSYTLLAASSGAEVHAFEPDPNNRRFLKRNLKANGLTAGIISQGTWNERAVLPWRSQSAMSSVQGVGMLSKELPALQSIDVDTIDRLVALLNLDRVDVIKMDIEGAEVEAIEGAENTIKKYRPLLLIEAYHIRDGKPTKDRVLDHLKRFGISDSCIRITEKTLIIAERY